MCTTDEQCNKCLGRGYLVKWISGTKCRTRNCTRCGGSGSVRKGQRNPFNAKRALKW